MGDGGREGVREDIGPFIEDGVGLGAAGRWSTM
jgi:hypothetical protein